MKQKLTSVFKVFTINQNLPYTFCLRHGIMATTLTESVLVSAAIDFGTTYSGYAYSLRDMPEKIYTNKGWVADQLISFKTSTCVLLNPRKQFDSFGYDAENKYVELAENEQHQGWLLFRRFKMILHNKTVSWFTFTDTIVKSFNYNVAVLQVVICLYFVHIISIHVLIHI